MCPGPQKAQSSRIDIAEDTESLKQKERVDLGLRSICVDTFAIYLGKVYLF